MPRPAPPPRRGSASWRPSCDDPEAGTSAELNRCDHFRPTLALPPLFRPGPSLLWRVFPEIESVPEPVVVIGTGLERIQPLDDAQSGGATGPVIADHGPVVVCEARHESGFPLHAFPLVPSQPPGPPAQGSSHWWISWARTSA